MSKAIFAYGYNALSSQLKEFKETIILCDQNTEKHCLPLLNLSKDVKIVSFPAGESNKSAFTLNHIWNKLLIFEANRDTILINLGGGVVTDIGGLAASTYNRGIRFVNIPTTLMGMVDAANGGKTGINFNGLKNYIGTFNEPESILIWPEFLKTLPFEQIISGFAEMLKHALISDKTYFENLTNLSLSPENVHEIDWMPIIKTSVHIKDKIVSKDFKETGERKLLNFGHTIGHAIESYFGENAIPHGHCVAAGIICETWLSNKKGSLVKSDMEWIIHIFGTLFNRIKVSLEHIEEMSQLAIRDKKNSTSSINCVFLEQIGEATYDRSITLDEIKESLTYYSQHDWIKL